MNGTFPQNQKILSNRIVDNFEKESLLEILADCYSRKILQDISVRPKSATEINMKTQIPLCTIYRRLQILHDNKLVTTSGTISEDGKKCFLYKNRMKNIDVKFDGVSLELKVTLKN
jgi:hypothetical protein